MTTADVEAGDAYHMTHAIDNVKRLSASRVYADLNHHSYHLTADGRD